MSRLNFLLLLIVVICALSVVNATNRQRELFIALGRGQMQERQLQQELARLQYQQSALSKTTRVEGVATSDLKMETVTAGRTQYLTVAVASSTAADEAATSSSTPPASSDSASSVANASEVAAITSGAVPAGASAPAGQSAGSAASATASSSVTSARAHRARVASAAAAGASK